MLDSKERIPELEESVRIIFKKAKKEFDTNPWNQTPLFQSILDSILLVAREVDKIK